MENKQLETQIQEINSKLDAITAYIEEEQKRKRALDELKDDLTLIGKDAFGMAVEELDEISHHFEMEDLLHLVKRLLRNVRNLNRLFDMLESGLSFMDDAKPITRESFNSLLEMLDEMEKKGYFEFLKETVKIFDTIVTSFSVEDVVALRENIVSILQTVKGLTQPEMLDTVNNALGFFHYLGEKVEEDVSFWDIFKELKDPQTKKGMVFALHFLKNITQAQPNNNEK
ncbi:MAG: hypothetical protein Kow00108_26890 [Calditrichia bacterium]